MNLNTRQIQIVKTLYARNRALADGTDDQRRQLVMLIAQQVAFEFGPQWGTKRADAGRPLSKDAIAYSVAYGTSGTLLAWDLFNGSTRVPFDNPSSIDITGQVFVVVTPVDHLKAIVTSPVDPPADPPQPTDPTTQTQIDNIVFRLDVLSKTLELLIARLNAPIRTTTDYYHSHRIQL